MRTIFLLGLICLISSCAQKDNMKQPAIASKIPAINELHGQKIVDDYSWLRDPDWPDVKDAKVLEYLQSENQYFEEFFAPLNQTKSELFNELKGRIKLADETPYVKRDDYHYYSRTEEDKEYPIYCRKCGGMDSKEEILLDVNEIAKGRNFTKIGDIAFSPNHKLMAYAVDFAGDERYTIKVYDLEKQIYLKDEIPNTCCSIVWHEQLQGFFYTPVNENWRRTQAKFHKLATAYSDDKLILEETDTLYNVNLKKSGSKEFIFIIVGGHDRNEYYFVSMDDHTFTPKLIKKRKQDIFHEVDHNGNYFYIRTNEGAKNYKISKVPTQDLHAAWQDYIPEQQDLYLVDFDFTENYLILNYRQLGLPIIKIEKLSTRELKQIQFLDAAYLATGSSTNFIEDDVRISYSSLNRPKTTYNYDFATNQLNVLKTQEIPSGFNPEEYKVERVFVNSENVRVPVSLFYKKELFKKGGSNPIYLYGYGSYGHAVPPAFRNVAVSLANRGFIFAIAHIRGGDELGQEWYESAKFLNKKRTFADFIAVAEFLVQEKYTSAGNIAICGGSAGGLLIGNVINQRPELFKAAVAHVPFVDVLNTMLDESLPLTPGEFKEWGNPKEKDFFDYIKSYSPYDNIKAQDYPHIMVTAGLTDPRVTYWEAAKWVAKLRAHKTDNNTLIYKTNMDAGHGGASGRFDYLKEVAEELAFLFHIFKIAH